MKRFLLLIVAFVLLTGILTWTAKGEAADCFPDENGEYVCDARPGIATFSVPTNPDSFIDHVTYAWLEDGANVYAGPDPGAAIIRNVGVGFLYVTLSDVVDNNGQRWYGINPGEYMRGEDVHVVSTSPFLGLQVNVQPERPFGWILQEIRPSTAAGQEPDQTYQKLFRYTFFQVYDAVEANDGWIWYDIGGGRWIPQTHVGLVDVDPRPEGVGPTDYWTEVDLYEQTFAAYVGDQMVFASLISSGLNRWPTHEGLFQVWSRHIYTKMSGAEGKVDYYFIEDVPHTMFFDDDIALHGAFWHDRFGYKHSHGCVNMPPKVAEWVYEWSANAPTDLWVWVHTSDPAHYFTRYQQ